MAPTPAARASLASCLLLCSFASGCADERPHPDARGCSSGVAIVLEAFATRFAASLPVVVRACFDRDCDVVRIVRHGEHGSACAWDPGGPPAQLTTCAVREGGGVEIDIARVDGADYGNGARHVVAISVTGAAGVLYTHAEEVRLIASGDSACFVDGVDLKP